MIVAMPDSLRIPPPEPAAPSTTLSRTLAPVTERVPPVAPSPWTKMPPPPLSAMSPEAVLLWMSPPVTLSVPAEDTQSPPPSLAARLLNTNESTTLMVPAPVRWRPPPLPGAALATLPTSSVLVIVVVDPAVASMAPPARVALLFSIFTPDVESTPLLSTAPPLLLVASTAVPLIRVMPTSWRLTPEATSKWRSDSAAASTVVRRRPWPVTMRASVTSRSPVVDPSSLEPTRSRT